MSFGFFPPATPPENCALKRHPVKTSHSTEDQLLNTTQQKHLLVTLKHADHTLSEIEHVLDTSGPEPLFAGHQCDFSPGDVHEILKGIHDLRVQMAAALERFGVAVPAARIGALHSIETSLDHIDHELEELAPHAMRGYGALAPAAGEHLESTIDELQTLVRRTRGYVRKRRAGQ
jgi:hypothetical protein